MNIWIFKALKRIHFIARVKWTVLNKNYKQHHNILTARRAIFLTILSIISCQCSAINVT